MFIKLENCYQETASKVSFIYYLNPFWLSGFGEYENDQKTQSDTILTVLGEQHSVIVRMTPNQFQDFLSKEGYHQIFNQQLTKILY